MSHLLFLIVCFSKENFDLIMFNAKGRKYTKRKMHQLMSSDRTMKELVLYLVEAGKVITSVILCKFRS